MQGDPQVGVGVAGDVNVTVSFEGRVAGGLALNKRAFMIAAPGSQPRMFQVYAQVDSVSPSTGSLAGGTLVTIRGRGFPSSAAAASTAITALRVGGMACSVVSSSFDTLTCTTQAAARAPPSTPWCRWNISAAVGVGNATDGNTNSTAANITAAVNAVCWDGSIKGRYPGMRGVLYEFFNR
jgi:hypothetical protein